MSFRARTVITALTCVLSCLAPHTARAQSASFPQPIGWPEIRGATHSDETLGPGVKYERWSLDTAMGPLQLSLATIDLRNPLVSLRVASHHDAVQGPDEKLSSMADRVHAEVGINADYFDIGESGAPLNIVVHDGRIAHQPDGAAALLIQSGHMLMRSVGWHASLTDAGGVEHPIGTLNEWTAASTIALVTDELGTSDAFGAFEAVLTPVGQGTTGSGTYRISAVSDRLATLLPLAAGGYGVLAHGSAADTLGAALHVGDTVTLALQTDPPLAGLDAAVGGGPLLVNDGALAVDPAPPAPEETEVRNPVTAAGVSADGSTMWLVVVDGRAPARSIGLTRPMLAALMLRLGANQAMAFDSGGSSEMVVRHLGDPTVSVANTPSDGRERGLADGFFVVNAAPTGALQQLILRAPAVEVLRGSHLALQVAGIDANSQPVAVPLQSLDFSADPAESASIDRQGVLSALQPGDVAVRAASGTVVAQALVRVVADLGSLQIAPIERSLSIGSHIQLNVLAYDRTGLPVATEPLAVHWSASGDAGTVGGSGEFIAAEQAGKSVVTASVGNAAAQLDVLVGEHAVVVQQAMRAGAGEGGWHFVAQPAGLHGDVAQAPAPDGAVGLSLAYDFRSAAATRAVYAESNVPLCGRPLAVAVDVFGDGSGSWLRGAYRNADGNTETVTLARHIDWRGWRTVRAQLPPQSAWPIAWTRFYVVERDRNQQETGRIWLRNFNALHPGPPTVGCAD